MIAVIHTFSQRPIFLTIFVCKIRQRSLSLGRVEKGHKKVVGKGPMQEDFTAKYDHADIFTYYVYIDKRKEVCFYFFPRKMESELHACTPTSD